MKGYNRSILMGNLTRDPEVRYSQSGVAVANVTLACNRSVKQADGSYKDQADFVGVVIFGKTGEMVGRYFHKGSGMLVEGRIQTRSYEKDGQKRYVTEVVADQVMFAGGNGQAQASAPAPQPAASAAPAAPVQPRYQAKAPVNVQEFPMDISNMNSAPMDVQEDIPF